MPAAIASVAVLSACVPNLNDIFGGDGSSPPASVAGKWSTFAISSSNARNIVDLEANISQSTGSIFAAQNVLLSNSPCEFGTDSLNGTVKGSAVNFTLSFGTGHPTATFTGTVSSNGLSMSGNFSQPAGDCSPASSGKWTATKFADSSGSYSGALTSVVTERSFSMAAVVQEDTSNNLQVTANLTGGGCVVLNLTGLAIGSVLQLENADETITVIAQAAVPTYATLQVAYSFAATSCGAPADNGTGSLTKTSADAVISLGERGQLNPITRSLLAKAQELISAEK